MRPLLNLGILAFVLANAAPASADQFDALQGQPLIDAPTNPAAHAQTSLTVEQLGSLPRIFNDARAAVLVVRTDQGNLARLLVSPGFRKPPSGRGEPVPVLLIERFETFEMPGARNRIGRGRDLMLFDGFQLDLDSGQVVPDGQGGDLGLTSDGGKRSLNALGEAKLFTFDKSPLPATASAGQLTAGRGVAPCDFAGSFRLVANGQFSGDLTLEVEEDGSVKGRYRSDETGTSYRVTGTAGRSAQHRIELTIQLPRSQMTLDGLLWTQGKAAFSGAATLLDRPYGFIAVRVGESIEPEAAAVRSSKPPDDKALVVTVTSDGPWHVGDRSLDDAALVALVRESRQGAEPLPVRIAAAPNVPYRRLAALIDLLGAEAPVAIQLSSPTTEP